ncbi:glycoside hydrolase family 2 protein [Xylanimonas protaetiae]|uniref:Beta-galactosidase n=1 Tax=Xylanimonas protaetiae TaxID=2509457 RepID=A0A4P6F4B0_9MICO|nr:sugar-binding domain-containing protein [Xylanimonas protaetiae]QAY70760.1 beta-galactosidase [Xylanimonas protaetiae]
MNETPRPEHPRPQLVRDEWVNLNGTWEFELDRGDSGIDRGLLETPYEGRILVPFAPESAASGIGNPDFLSAVWYRRTVRVPQTWAGRDVLLHFGAVDHDATVWVDGREVARHRGGFTSFTADLTGLVRAGDEFTVVVRARDTRDEPQARGKQATYFHNTECFYTRTTGIWQTVWMEAVAPAHVAALQVVPQVADSTFRVTAELSSRAAGLTLEAVLRDGAGDIVTASVPVLELAPSLRLEVPADRVRLWSPQDPHLYDLTVRLLDGGAVVDEVSSYAGLRSVTIDGNRLLLNGEPVFQRLVLDQGYWPDTLMTAPSDEALRRDIELGIAAGFNGARIHQRVAEERYLYHADRLGYLVWGEFGDWGAGGAGPRGDNQRPTASFVTQWVEAVRRDRNHPSIVGWCPLNETWQALHDRITQLDDVTVGMYLATKAADPTRPVIDASGYSHRVRGVDVYDSHCYEQDPDRFRALMSGLAEGTPYVNLHDGAQISLPYEGQPYFVSEYGGIWWNEELAQRALAQDPTRAGSWGYGERVRTAEEWHERFAGLTRVLLDDPLMFGYCYTQLTDTFQEENGIYDADRNPKVDIERVRDVQVQQAAYEKRAQAAEDAA